MLKLSDIKKIKKLDPQNMLSSLELLSGQIEEVWTGFSDLKVPLGHKNARHIVVVGMGGSGLGIHFIKTLYKDKIKLPIEIVNDYSLPAYVGPETLLVICSYSGNTEEVLAAFKSGRQRKAKMFAISSGGKLAVLAKSKGVPQIVFSTESNPSGMPRVGVGYKIGALHILFNSLGILKIDAEQIKKISATVRKYCVKFGVLSVAGNEAKDLALKIKERSIWVVGAEHLSGNAHIVANQINETSKRFSGYYLLPEMNHHLLEGLFFPKSNKKDLLFLFLESKNYSDKILKRISITKNILKKNGIAYLSYHTHEASRVDEAHEILTWGGFFSFYLGVVQDINPSAVPFVDYLKKQLSS